MWILLLLLSLAAASVAAQPQITQFQIRSFTEQCLSLLQQGRFEYLARLYHYPADMNQAALGDEQHQVAASLAELGQLFGSFDETSTPEKPQNLHQFEVQSASGHYWSERPRYYQIVYNTTFSRQEEGSLIFRIVVYDHRLQLRSIGYALSAAAPDAEEKKAVIDRHMTRFFEQLQMRTRE